MIWRLRKKFIQICSLSFISVFLILLSAIYAVNTLQTNAMVDELTDIISENNGGFPKPGNNPKPGGSHPEHRDFINQETPFSTRFFTAQINGDGKITEMNMAAIASVSEEEAKQFVETALASGKERGWIEHYRYKVVTYAHGSSVVLVDGSTQRSAAGSFWYISMLVFIGGSLFVLLLIVLISKRAVKPAAESYEKQKQFITDASHELKTPLTLILANLDIARSELGENEWLNDIRSEGEQMSALVKQLVILARMDEEGTAMETQPFSLSGAVSESVAYFHALADQKNLRLTSGIAPNVTYCGDESAIRRLLSILTDNAVKYCDAGGEIRVTLKNRRHPVITVENSYAAVGATELNRLFDRFYRADKARTAGEGFGIGLSIAKAIAERHRGQLAVQNVENRIIRFTVRFT